MTVRVYAPDATEVTEFRRMIFEQDLGLTANHLYTINYENKDEYETFAYWYCDEKFLSTGFDRVLIYYHEGKPACICGGTHFNKDLYRGMQMYYTLKLFRGKKECNNLAGKPGGFIETHIKRAIELDCKAYFVSVHVYDKRHQRFWEGYLKRDIVIKGSLHPRDRAYHAGHFIHLEKEYPIMNVNQKIMYHDIHNAGLNFDELFYNS